MERWQGKVAIVTGASSGIGAAIAEQLVKNGLQVVGVARRKEKIEELAEKLLNMSGKLFAVQADISKEEDVLQAFQWVKDNLGPIHILVNSAGIIRETTLMDGETKLWKEVFDTNVLGLCIATREAVKDMKQNNIDGHIVHINSFIGQKVPAVADINVYPASKFAITALTETLRQELNAVGSKIKISGISPGLVETNLFTESFRVSGNKADISKKFDNYKYWPALKACDIADAAIYILGTPPHVQVHELLIKPIGEPE